jgi:di/tripeptidase
MEKVSPIASKLRKIKKESNKNKAISGILNESINDLTYMSSLKAKLEKVKSPLTRIHPRILPSNMNKLR